MPFKIIFTDAAKHDLDDIFFYIMLHDSIGHATHIFENIKEVILSLADSPERGTYPKDILSLGYKNFREIYFKPYRIIYRVLGNNVFVDVICDGRRDMQTILQLRLLE